MKDKQDLNIKHVFDLYTMTLSTRDTFLQPLMRIYIISFTKKQFFPVYKHYQYRSYEYLIGKYMKNESMTLLQLSMDNP